jgi:SAM-dependent methyltransferase
MLPTQSPIPTQFLTRQDESADENFYAQARLVTHIDDSTIASLTNFYDEFIEPNHSVLDLMSSWVSHLPVDRSYAEVVGLGMNAEELAANPQLTQWRVHNLNTDPNLPFDAQQFDRALIAVSIQYLTQPVEVMRSIARCLKPRGKLCIAMSHRLFPTKAIAAFRLLPPDERIRLVAYYLEQGGFVDIATLDQSPPQGDPLWIITGTKAA